MDKKLRHDIVNIIAVISMIAERSGPLGVKAIEHFIDNDDESFASMAELKMAQKSLSALGDQAARLVALLKQSRDADKATEAS